MKNRSLTPVPTWLVTQNCFVTDNLDFERPWEKLKKLQGCVNQQKPNQTKYRKMLRLNKGNVVRIFEVRRAVAEFMLSEMEEDFLKIIEDDLKDKPKFMRKHVRLIKLGITTLVPRSKITRFTVATDAVYVSYLLQQPQHWNNLRGNLEQYLLGLFSEAEVNKKLQEQEVENLFKKVCEPMIKKMR